MRMIEQFLNCPASNVIVSHYLEDLLQPFQPIHPEELARLKSDIMDHRETDLTAQMPVVWDVVEDVFYENPMLLCSEDRNYFAINQHFDVPFPDQPRIGFYGWHQVTADLATILLPMPDEDNSGITYTYGINVARSGSGTFIVYTGGTIRLSDDGGWVVLNFAAADPNKTDVTALFDRISARVDEQAEYANLAVLQLLLSKTFVLLCHTIITADPTVLQTSTPPRKLRAANAKRGKRTVSGRRWIELPGLKYDSKTGRWSADPKREGGVRWHRVRGTYRVLTSEKFTHKRGQRIWVRPHTKGSGEHSQGPGYRAKAG